MDKQTKEILERYKKAVEDSAQTILDKFFEEEQGDDNGE